VRSPRCSDASRGQAAAVIDICSILGTDSIDAERKKDAAGAL
jgi:hypothetical protein